MAKCSNSNLKYDWYQTETNVVINILVKQVMPENVRVDLSDSELSCTAKLSDGSDFSLSWSLLHPVIANEVKYKVLPSKIEIRLKKVVGIMWTKLEGETNMEVAPPVQNDDSARLYPSSKQEKKDWDKITQQIKKEEAEEKLEGEAALNQLFQKIYADGNDETRKAMNKSFMESGGTMLSTSWNEVGNKKIEVRPPDGVEFKKWEP